MKNKRSIRGRLFHRSDETGWTGAPWVCGVRAEISSNREAVVTGIKCICDYTSECIVLGYRGGRISFCGRGLSCSSYMKGAVCIRGHIISVHYCE